MFSIATFIFGTLFGYYLATNNLAGASYIGGQQTTGTVRLGTIEDKAIQALLLSSYPNPAALTQADGASLSNPFAVNVAAAQETCKPFDTYNMGDLLTKILIDAKLFTNDGCQKVVIEPDLKVLLFKNTKEPFDIVANVVGKMKVTVTALKMVDGKCVEKVIRTYSTDAFSVVYNLKYKPQEGGLPPLPYWEPAPDKGDYSTYKIMIDACIVLAKTNKVTIGTLDPAKCKDCTVTPEK